MRSDRIQYISRYIEGYTGYRDLRDLEKVNIFIRDRLARVYKVLMNISGNAPPDVSSYFMMVTRLSNDIINMLSMEYNRVRIEADLCDEVIELDYKAVEILNMVDKTIESISGAPPLPMYREYSFMLYRMVARLKEILKRRREILGSRL